ncbi:MAG TPA: M14 family zinc carboxypeptidase [Candidatus Krumholzibacteria bacterium]|jgi:hypothetical protein
MPRSPRLTVPTLCFLALLLCGGLSPAQDLANDDIATAAILEATTDERFLTEWVRTLPDHPTIPSPRDFLGYTVGTPSQLTHVDDIHAYFRALAGASDRVHVESIGQSHGRREMIAAIIGDVELLGRSEELRADLHRLADPRGLDAATVERILQSAVPVYWLTAGLHSPELGPPEMVMELAYRLAVEQREPFTSIRKNVLTIITPVLEVDGRARQVEWWRRNVRGFTDYKDMPPRSAPFWGEYSFHDNNRDAIAVSQPLTQNFFDFYFRWMPTISLDLHESVPFLYVSTGTGPYNERVDPITVGEWHALANYEVTRLTQLGLPGVWTWGFYTGWYPGYLLWVTNNHNSMGRFFETFGNGTAETLHRDLRDARYAGEKLSERQWYRSIPPDEQIEWSMRNNINFMLSGAVASLEMVSQNGAMFLRNFNQKAQNSIATARKSAPHAFVIRKDQRDIAAARDVVAILQRQGIEMAKLKKDFDLKEQKLSQDDVLIRLDQPYGPLARNLLEKQGFPEEVDVPPYDDVAWTLGLHMGVDIEAIDDIAVLDIDEGDLDGEDLSVAAPELPNDPKVWAIPHHAQRELGPLMFSGAFCHTHVLAAETSFEHKGEMLPAGTLLIENPDDCAKLRAELERRGLRAIGLNKLPDIPTHVVEAPRIALYHAWFSTQNAGWVRFSFDEAGVPYTMVDKDDVRAGALAAFDVLLMPAFGGNSALEQVVAGIDEKWSPLPYTVTAETPSHGRLASSEDITGGLGFDGLAAIEAFVRQGGTLIGLGSGGVVAGGSGMSARISTTQPSGLNTPGSFLTCKVLTAEHPLVYGYPAQTHVFRGNGTLYDVGKYDRHLAVVQFGNKEVGDFNLGDKVDEPDDLVISGGIVKGDSIDGMPALLVDSLGKGKIVLFSWNPMHRHLNHHDHGFVYNALMHWNDLPIPQRPGVDHATSGE